MYGGRALLEDQKAAIIAKSSDFNIGDAAIFIDQGLTFSSLDDKNIEVYKLKEQIISLNSALIKSNEAVDSLLQQPSFGKVLLNEIKTIYPQIDGCSYSESMIYNDTLAVPLKTSIITLSTKRKLLAADKTKINNWCKKRLNKNAIKLYFE